MKKTLKLLSLCLLSGFLILPLFSQTDTNTIEIEKRVITLEEALNFALKYNPDLQAQKISLDTSAREYKARWNSLLPSVSLNGGITNSASDTQGTSTTWSTGASLSLNLNASIPNAMKLSALNYDITLTTYKNLENEIAASVFTKFYTLVAEYQNITILEANKKLYESSYSQVLSNYKRGLASELDMLTAQYSYLSIQPSIDKAKSAYYSDLANFAILIGLPKTTIAIPDDTEIPVKKIKLLPGKELSEKYLSNRYDIILKELALSKAELNLSVTKASSYIPSLSISDRFSAGPKSEFNGKINWSNTLSASIAIPVSDFIPASSVSLKVKAAEDAVNSANLSYENALKKAENDIATKASEVNRLWESISVSELNYKIAKRSRDLSNEGYNAGLVSRTDVESASQKMTQAELSVVQSKIDYFSAVNNLANALQISVDELYETMGDK